MRLTWEEFVAKHAKNVIDAALRVMGNPEDADDIAQEVFLEIYRNNRMLELDQQPALIRTMSTRRAIDCLRRRKPSGDLNEYELKCREPEPSQSAIAAELDERFRYAITALPPREAEVFCLSALDGNSASDIAQLLNISKGAVAKSLSSARSRLSKSFGWMQVKNEP